MESEEVDNWRDMAAEQLMEKKDSMEEELQIYKTVLENQGGVGMEGRLIDNDGFPRDDIDIYAVRRARNKIICLRNDHKVIMKLIEEKLHQIHAEVRLRKGVESGGVARGEERKLPETFARISQISDGSPADTAGLKLGDKIAGFGSVTAANFTGLRNVADVVRHSAGSAVHVVLIRRGEVISISLTPHSWAGQGLLGCVIVPS